MVTHQHLPVNDSVTTSQPLYYPIQLFYLFVSQCEFFLSINAISITFVGHLPVTGALVDRSDHLPILPCPFFVLTDYSRCRGVAWDASVTLL